MIKDTLMKNFSLNVDILECLRRESCDILFESCDGVLIFDKISNIYMISLVNLEIAKDIIYKIPSNANIIVAHQKYYCNLIEERFKFKEKLICYNTICTNKWHIEVPRTIANIELLDEGYTEEIYNHYSSKEIVDKNYILNRLKSKTFFGAFVNNNLCGFIGTHEEGSIGMLEVFKEYRGLGIGKALQAVATNDALAHKRYAYGQVKEDNINSLNLQKSLDFQLSKDKIYWYVMK